MDYYYKEQGNYLDANTSGYLKHKLCLALKITFKLKKKYQEGAYHHGYIPFRITLLNHSGFSFRQFKCVYKQDINCHHFF